MRLQSAETAAEVAATFEPTAPTIASYGHGTNPSTMSVEVSDGYPSIIGQLNDYAQASDRISKIARLLSSLKSLDRVFPYVGVPSSGNYDFNIRIKPNHPQKNHNGNDL